MRYLLPLLAVVLMSGVPVYAETLSDFAGKYELSFEDSNMISDKTETIPCRKFLTIREDSDGTGLWVEQFNDYKVIYQLYFGLGAEKIDQKHFAVTTLFNNTLKRDLYKKTFFHPRGKIISGYYVALLGDSDMSGYGDLYFEQSGDGYITSACYYKKANEDQDSE